MAKAATAPAPGMTLPDMKSILNRATRQKPGKVAFAQAKDKSALLSMDMSKGPKILSKVLELEHQDAKDFRWGLVFVDEAEPTTAKFRINKPAKGMGKRLVKTLKGTGYNEVVFLEDGEGDILDPKQDVVLGGSKEEPDEDGTTAPPQGAVPQPPPPPPPGPPPSTAPLYDAKELEAMLRSLIPQIPGAGGNNADLLARLKKYAADANLFIKTNNLKTAAESLKALGDAIDAAKAGGVAPGNAPGNAPGGQPDNADTLRNTLANMQLAIVKTGGPQEDAMSALAQKILALLNAGDLAQAKTLMDELSLQLAAAAKAKGAADLRKKLDALIPRIEPAVEKSAALRGPLNKLAADADTALKANDIDTAAAAIKKLADALDKVAPEAPAAATTATADLTKIRSVWQAAQQKITADINNLRSQLLETYKPEQLDGEVGQRYDAKVATLLQAVGANLGEKIDALGAATDAEARKTLVEGARAIITGYQTALADPVVPDLDKNPFVPLGIQNALKALSGLAAAIH